MKTPLAYSYTRFSSIEQRKGDSLRRQTQAAEEWCDRKGITLAEPFRDEGVSAFRGKHRFKGALSRFLRLVEDGTIEPGSYLVVESFDRLSREDVKTALGLFLQITGAGIHIVTLIDGMEYGPDCDERDLIMTLLSFSRAHNENVHRQHRTKASWEGRRKAHAEQGTVVTGRCPQWLRVSDGRKGFDLIPDRAAIVKKIFKMAAAGHGANYVTKDLNRSEVPTFGRAKAWGLSYVKKILTNRSVIGEFTPHLLDDGQRVPLDPISDYYPKAVSLELFHTVTNLRGARPSFRGRSSEFNVFSHVIRDWQGGSMSYENKNRTKGWHYLVPSDSLKGIAPRHAWQYDDFLGEFLKACREASREAPSIGESDDTVSPLRAQLAEVELKIERATDTILDMGGSHALTSRLKALEAEKVKLGEELAAAESSAEAIVPEVREIDWEDTDGLRANIRRSVRRIVVCAELRWFYVEFMDGLRVFRSVAMPSLDVKWTASHRALDGVRGAWVDVDGLCEWLRGMGDKSPRERLLWVRWQFIKAGGKAAGVSVRTWAKSLGYVVNSPSDFRLKAPTPEALSACETGASVKSERTC